MGVNKSPLGNFVAFISLGLERGSSEGESEVVRHAQDAAFFPDIHAAELQKAGLSVMLGVAKDGLGCLGCAAARFENLEAGARVHGFDPDAMVADINALIED